MSEGAPAPDPDEAKGVAKIAGWSRLLQGAIDPDEAKGAAKIAGWSRLLQGAIDPDKAEGAAKIAGWSRLLQGPSTRTKPNVSRRSPAGAGSFYERSSSNGDEKHGGVHPHLQGALREGREDQPM